MLYARSLHNHWLQKIPQYANFKKQWQHKQQVKLISENLDLVPLQLRDNTIKVKINNLYIINKNCKKTKKIRLFKITKFIFSFFSVLVV